MVLKKLEKSTNQVFGDFVFDISDSWQPSFSSPGVPRNTRQPAYCEREIQAHCTICSQQAQGMCYVTTEV